MVVPGFYKMYDAIKFVYADDASRPDALHARNVGMCSQRVYKHDF